MAATDKVKYLDSAIILDNQIVVLNITAEKNLINDAVLLQLVEAKHFFNGDDVGFLAVHVEVRLVHLFRVGLFAVVEVEFFDDLHALLLFFFLGRLLTFKRVKSFPWALQNISKQFIHSA